MERRTGKAETVKVRDDASVTVERLAWTGRSIIEFRRLDQERGRISGYAASRNLRHVHDAKLDPFLASLDRRYFNRRSIRFQVSGVFKYRSRFRHRYLLSETISFLFMYLHRSSSVVWLHEA